MTWSLLQCRGSTRGSRIWATCLRSTCLRAHTVWRLCSGTLQIPCLVRSVHVAAMQQLRLPCHALTCAMHIVALSCSSLCHTYRVACEAGSIY